MTLINLTCIKIRIKLRLKYYVKMLYLFFQSFISLKRREFIGISRTLLSSVLKYINLYEPSLYPLFFRTLFSQHQHIIT